MLLLAGLATLSACQDTLDTHPSSIFTEDVVWGSLATADAFVNATYSSVLTSGFAGGGVNTGWESRTPNGCQASQVGEGIDGVATELGISNSSDFGSNRFALLRRCNLIIDKATNSSLAESDKNLLIAEGHFLRGLIFFDQARKMGRFVPLTQVLTESDSLASRVEMTGNVAESYNYVVADLEEAVKGLPETASAGRATKWAAEVILSRACLQAYAYTKDTKFLNRAKTAAQDVIQNSGVSLASDYGSLFNEDDPNNPEILLGYYRLADNTQVVDFDELINVYPNIGTDDMTTSRSATGYPSTTRTFESWGIFFPTQDLVDQYLAIDEETGEAKPWYETSQFKENVEELDPSTVKKAGSVDSYRRVNGQQRRIPTPQDLKQTKTGYPVFQRYLKLKDGATRNLSQLMYSNRDARLAATVVTDSTQWVGVTCCMNLSGNLSQGVRDKEDGGWYNTTTGYYWRKGTLEKLNPRAFYSVKVDYHQPVVRLGEAYMNLAEADLLLGDVPGAVAALNQTRTVHGHLPASTASTAEDAWADYIRERNCEMAYEAGDIYFSYLRWGKYGSYANHGRQAGDIIYDLDRPVYKIEISRDRTKALIGQLTLMGSANRNFTEKRYLLPINQGFLNTREAYGLNHVQNEGW